MAFVHYFRPKMAICNNIFKLSGNSFQQLFCLILISCAFVKSSC